MISKRNRYFLIASLAVALLATGALLIPPVRALLLFQQSGSHPGTLDYYAEQAQAQGLTQYHFTAGIYEYPVSRTWDDVLARFSFVVAEPIASQSYPTPGVGGDCCIESWYRFRVVEQLSIKPVPFSLGAVPADVAPAQADQVLVWKAGGTLYRNGVQLIADEPSFPGYIPGQRYLLILYFDPASRIGDVAMGSYGAYLINASGILSSADPVGSVFQSELASRYGSSLDQLRAALNGSPPPPTPIPTPTPGQSEP